MPFYRQEGPKNRSDPVGGPFQGSAKGHGSTDGGTEFVAPPRPVRALSSCGLARVRHAFRPCLGRDPQPRERDVPLRLLAKERAAYAERPDEAKALLPPEAKDVDAGEFAAWTGRARLLLDLDEFITREQGDRVCCWLRSCTSGRQTLASLDCRAVCTPDHG
jgi:hypothetical protein